LQRIRTLKSNVRSFDEEEQEEAFRMLGDEEVKGLEFSVEL